MSKNSCQSCSFYKNALNFSVLFNLESVLCDLIYYIWSDSGFHLYFKNKNKMDIIQNLIIQNVIIWPKIALDQLANGLEILGFRDEMKQHIDHFEKLFIVKEKLMATIFLNTLSFQDKLNADEENTSFYWDIWRIPQTNNWKTFLYF